MSSNDDGSENDGDDNCVFALEDRTDEVVQNMASNGYTQGTNTWLVAKMRGISRNFETVDHTQDTDSVRIEVRIQ